MIVRVCASSANLGPGFDCFGLAWQCYDCIEFLPGDRGLEIDGCDERFKNADNLAYRAYKATLDEAGLPEKPLRIRFKDADIPVSRGLGSSAALIVGGVMAARAMRAPRLSMEDMLRIATRVEGHPDNIAPALYGGLTVSTMDGSRVVTRPFPLSDKLYFAALIPDFELSTELARSVLPTQLSRQDAVFNISRAALLLKALEDGDLSLLRVGLQDKLHQSYRKGLINGYDAAEALAYGQGADGVCISGAGSTMLCISGDKGFTSRMEKALSEVFPRWRVIPLLPDRQGAAVLD